jgi:hypothetical protein
MAFLLVLVAATVLLTGCGEPRRSFREATLQQANALLADPEIAVVEALDPRARAFGTLAPREYPSLDGTRDRGQPVVRPGAVLVLGSSQAAGFRSAARLAREGHETVWVFVPKSEDERRGLVLPAVQAKEGVSEPGS